jgi:hypothetical protein
MLGYLNPKSEEASSDSKAKATPNPLRQLGSPMSDLLQDMSAPKAEEPKEAIADMGALLKLSQEEMLAQITGVTDAESGLSQEMSKLPAFQEFPVSQAWRMLMDGKHQEGRGKFGFENEKGYMAALMKAYTHMLKGLDGELTTEVFEQLHDYAVDGVLDREKKTMDKGFRNSNLHGEGFGVDQDTWSIDGYKELKEKHKNRNKEEGSPVGAALAEAPEKMVGPDIENKVMKLKPLVKGQCERFAKVVIATYHTDIENAVSADDQLKAIVKCCQDLDQLHLFVDGNIRTIAFLILNKLLLQNQMEPVILDEPNIFDCKSVHEIMAAVRSGQIKFNSYKNKN